MTNIVSLKVLLSLGAGIIFQADVETGIDLTALSLITPAEEVETNVLSSTFQPPSKMTDSMDKKVHLDLILRAVRTEEKNPKN